MPEKKSVDDDEMHRPPDEGPVKVLVVEDSDRLQRSLRHGLHRSGFAVDVVGDGEEGLAYAWHGKYDVIILDLMLPKLDGLTLLRRLRAGGSDVHVLILSARDQVPERIQGLQLGADDYLTKPFAFEELVARRGRAVSKLELLDHLYAGAAHGSENAVEVLIHQLRKKIRIEGRADIIQTRRGHGYLIE